MGRITPGGHGYNSYLGRYIGPLTDFGFKRIFGSEPHKELLIAFLNALFNGRKIIQDLVYNPQESDGPATHHLPGHANT